MRVYFIFILLKQPLLILFLDPMWFLLSEFMVNLTRISECCVFSPGHQVAL